MSASVPSELAKCVDHIALSVLKPQKTLKVVMQVHISAEGVHRRGECLVGTKGKVTAIYDDTNTARNSLRSDSLRIGPWTGACTDSYAINNDISRITADSAGSTWVRVWIACLGGAGTGYAPRNCEAQTRGLHD